MPKNLPHKQKNFLGNHLILDLYNCDSKALESLEKCYWYLDNLPEIIGVIKLSPPFIIYTDAEKYPDKAGLSGWIPITDLESKNYSGISIHTLTPTNFVSIDIFSYKRYHFEQIKRFTIKIFKPKNIEEKFLLRG